MASEIDSLFKEEGQAAHNFIGIPDLFSQEETSKEENVREKEQPEEVSAAKEEGVEKKSSNKEVKSNEEKEVVDVSDSDSPGFIDILSDLSEVQKDIEEGKYENIDDLRKVADALVKDGIIVPYEDNTDVKTYTADEIKGLIRDNLDHIRKQAAVESVEKFFEDLPYEVQDLILYHIGGGKDIKGMLRDIYESRNIEDLDVSEDQGAEYVVRKYLSEVEKMSNDEIEEELKAYKESSILKNRAEKYKNRLVSMHKEEVERKKREQEALKEKQRKMYEDFVKNVNEQISGSGAFIVEIPSDVLETIRRGIINNDYDSITGTKTNLLGNLIEKHLISSPNIRLIAEAVYMLMDPEGYKKNLYDRIRTQVLSEERARLKESVAKSTTPDTHIADEFNTSVKARRSSSSRKLNIDTSNVERLKEAFRRR